ncbi:V-type ATP synthase subunit I [Enterococcus sp. JM4C]|uniref:V-type ATP synthase subunit I n=1 Tax=Candidatus Enterococcus huntleyi TaxID=1857217 RepID=UPI00137A25D5|nr:V-type ATP synthase subunit I [Enterococcus sp. JM4C]KAF1295717.1 V-type ATP synthase subunit I [Enterococcus sp. JM4C]
MAVSKIEKVSIILEKKKLEKVLQILQGLQAIEVRDLSNKSASNFWVEDYFSGAFEKKARTNEEETNFLLLQIEEAILFMQRNGSVNQKKTGLRRQALSLNELEEPFDETQFAEDLKSILQIKKEWTAVQEKKSKAYEKETWLSTWQYLDINPSKFDSTKTKITIGSLRETAQVEFIEALNQQTTAYVEELFHHPNETYIGLVYLNNQQKVIDEILSQFHFTKVDYPYNESPKKELQLVQEEISTLVQQEKELAAMIGDRAAQLRDLQWAEEVYLAHLERERVKNQLVQAEHLTIIQGWVAVEDKDQLLTQCEKEFGEQAIYISFEEPTSDEIGTEIPTKLKNHPLIRPFEMLTEMYSLPKYGEIDPTPWMAPFYFVFFGMMVADIGYGLVMLLGTIGAQKLMVFPRGTARFVKFFQILSIPTILWGFVYSSFFGMALPKTVFGVTLPFPILSTTDDMQTILILSVIFGFIQILLGLFIAGKEHIKRKEYLSAISNGFSWQGILIGIALAAVGALLLDNQALLMVGAIIAGLSALSILIIPIIQSPSKLKGAAKGAYNLYGITSYIGDLVSYTRLMALGISGGSIASAFNLLVAFMPPIARFTIGIVLILVLHGLNLFLSLLGAYVHGARLQYVEYFGKFYSGGGRPFVPLKTAEKYVNIETKKTNSQEEI